jgi:predicted GH43/DUF377 family glycosyl hydrolase
MMAYIFMNPKGYNKLFGTGPLQTFGIEDCRVTHLEDKYYLTFTAVSDSGVGVGMRTTTDWKSFQSHGMILPPHNKDVAIFEEKINGLYYALHRPSSVDIGGNYIWLAQSPDGNIGATTNASLKPARACGIARPGRRRCSAHKNRKRLAGNISWRYQRITGIA